MANKVKLTFLLGLVLSVLLMTEASSMTRCPEFCRGMCGCEGTPQQVWPDDPCCFICNYEGMIIECCAPTQPGWPDGCEIWTPR